MSHSGNRERRLKFLEINYHCHYEYDRPEQVLEKHRSASGFAGFLAGYHAITLVKHLNYEGGHTVNGVTYRFFKSRNKFFYIPFNTHRFVKNEQPDIILVQGFIFLIQVLALRFQLGKRVKIIVQHHGERPFTGIKGFIQRFTDRFIDGYLFTSLANSEEWVQAGVIKDRKKIYETLAASTWFTKKSKEESRTATALYGKPALLWVGRLNENKDPLTVLTGFEKYLSVNPGATLHLIYQSTDLLSLLKNVVQKNPLLQSSVFFQGNIPHHQLVTWYSAADFFISGSHREGGSYALLEAMACGCIPIVTAIPSALKVIKNDQFGYSFIPGNPDSLFHVLNSLKSTSINEFAQKIEDHFKSELSFEAIALQMNRIFADLISK